MPCERGDQFVDHGFFSRGAAVHDSTSLMMVDVMLSPFGMEAWFAYSRFFLPVRAEDGIERLLIPLKPRLRSGLKLAP